MAAGRKLAGVVALVTLAASLAGCTSAEPQTTPEPTPSVTEQPASTSPEEPVALELAVTPELLTPFLSDERHFRRTGSDERAARQDVPAPS